MRYPYLMSDIRAKIKQLEQLQKKVDFLKQVIDFPKKLKAGDEDEKVVLPEVCDMVEKLLVPVIESLETGSDEFVGTMGVMHEKTPFTTEEVEFVKKLIDKARTRTPIVPEKEVEAKPMKEKKGPSSWVMSNQHLGGKRVRTLVLSQEVEGEVISLREPFVVIKLDSGKIHQSTLDKIDVINE